MKICALPNLCEAGKKAFAEVDLLCTKASTLEELVFGWLDDQGSLIFRAEFCQDAGKLQPVLWFHKTDMPIGYLELDSYISKNIRPVSEAIKEVVDAGGEIFCSDAWFDARDKQLGVSWHEGLCSYVVSAQAALEMALSYATADAGEAQLRALQEDFAEDILSDPGTRDPFIRPLISLCLFFVDQHTGKGWGENYTVFNNPTV